MPQELPQNCPIYTIKCFFEVHKVYVKGALPFNALFNDNPECSNVICAGFILSKASVPLDRGYLGF